MKRLTWAFCLRSTKRIMVGCTVIWCWASLPSENGLYFEKTTVHPAPIVNRSTSLMIIRLAGLYFSRTKIRYIMIMMYIIFILGGCYSTPWWAAYLYHEPKRKCMYFVIHAFSILYTYHSHITYTWEVVPWLSSRISNNHVNLYQTIPTILVYYTDLHHTALHETTLHYITNLPQWYVLFYVPWDFKVLLVCVLFLFFFFFIVYSCLCAFIFQSRLIIQSLDSLVVRYLKLLNTLAYGSRVIISDITVLFVWKSYNTSHYTNLYHLSIKKGRVEGSQEDSIFMLCLRMS